MSLRYEYRCRVCHSTYDSDIRANTLGLCDCGLGEARRVYGFQYTVPLQEHFNHTVNKPIRTDAQFREELKRKSEEYYLHTGWPANFQPIDAHDAAALGVTGEGLDATNADRMRRGLTPVHPNG